MYKLAISSVFSANSIYAAINLAIANYCTGVSSLFSYFPFWQGYT